ncbi:MAG: zinc dependent phospholipase C family protein [Candidatus Microthrix subdominans]|nr:zinc dependent phospholipase C family protein [Candidatus Microthrix sp.]MBK6439584.1 hypothetical protein [Candidatus Microthrix sp.]
MIIVALDKQKGVDHMPGPFTHIYTQRRVSEFLKSSPQTGGVNENFVRSGDGANAKNDLGLDPDLLRGLGPKDIADCMDAWPKFAALGAIGPDLFFFLQDYEQPLIPSDEVMLAMSLLYWLDDQGRLDDPWEGLLAIMQDVSGNTFVSLLRFLIKLNKLWQEFLDALDDLLGPLLDAVGQLLDDLTGGMLSALGDLFTQLKDDLLTLIAEEALSSEDIFSFFSLKMRRGVDEQSFLWSDMLHYRQTSLVPRRMLERARDLRASEDVTDREHGDQLVAFASSWITHVGTDVIAHSFINAQAGGPFRTHWQRHHLVENHLDAYNYECTGKGLLPADKAVGWIDGYEGLNHSALYFALQIPDDIDALAGTEKQGDWRPQPLPEADSRANRKERAKLLDTDGALPGWLGELLAQVLVEVYAEPAEGGLDVPPYPGERGPHPRNLVGSNFLQDIGDGTAFFDKWLNLLGIDGLGMASNELLAAITPGFVADVPEGFPMPWEIGVAYRFMLSWFKREFSTTLDMDKPPRPAWYTPPTSDFDFGPPDFSGVDPTDDPLSQLCESILALLDWIAKSLEKGAQLAYDLGKSALSGATYLPREWLYANITEPAWSMCESMRQVLVHMAYIAPQCEMRYPNGELRRPNEIDYELVTLGHGVDGAFAAALAAAWDPLGNLDADPALTAPALRNPKGGDGGYPWLPIRPTKTRSGQTTATGSFPFDSDVIEFMRPWGYPDKTNDSDPQRSGNTIETPATIATPYGQDEMPTVLFRGRAVRKREHPFVLNGC